MSVLSFRSLGRGGVGAATQLKFGVVSRLSPGNLVPIFGVDHHPGGARPVSTSATLLGKRNFRKFHMGNKRGTRLFRKARNAGEFPDMPIETEVRPIGFRYGSRHHLVPEMVPEFIVPDLTDFKLKPYVSYRAGETYQEALTPEELWQYVYFNKLDKDFKLGQLDEHGNSKAPSPEEEMTPDQAWTLARQTGCDIFSERVPRQWECLETDLKEWKKERLAKQGFEFYHDFMKEPYSPEMLLEENKDDDDVEPAPKFISPSAGPPIPKLDKKGKPIKPIEGQ